MCYGEERKCRQCVIRRFKNNTKWRKGTDKENKTKKRELELAQHVYLIRPRALEPKFSGPFEIVKLFRNNNYLLQGMRKSQAILIKVDIQQLFTLKLWSIVCKSSYVKCPIIYFQK